MLKKINQMKGKVFQIIIALILSSVVVFFSVNSVLAHQQNNHCEHFCHFSSPTPTALATPTDSPTASPSATPVDTDTPSPTETPVETPTPTEVPLTPAGAPEPAACTAPTWIPVVTYNGSHLDKDGNWVFSYSWTYPDSAVTAFWVSWGANQNDLPYSEVVNAHNKDFTMYGFSTNWIKVAPYNGCLGTFSPVLN